MKNFFGVLVILSFIPFGLSVFGLPPSWLAGEGVDDWEVYGALISIPTFIGSWVALVLLEREEERQRKAVWEFQQELGEEYERGVQENL